MLRRTAAVILCLTAVVETPTAISVMLVAVENAAAISLQLTAAAKRLTVVGALLTARA